MSSRYTRFDALPGTRPVRSQASTPAEIQAQFDPMSYQKGGALLRMIEDFVGEKAFRAGVHAYMERYAYKNAESAQLWREIEKASGKPVRAMAEKWLERPGVPVVDVIMASPLSRTLMLEQKRFSAVGAKDDSLWPIPLAIRYRLKGEKKARTHRMLLSDSADLSGQAAVVFKDAEICSESFRLSGRGQPRPKRVEGSDVFVSRTRVFVHVEVKEHSTLRVP